MFTTEEITEVTDTESFRRALSGIRQSLAENRFGRDQLFEAPVIRHLRYFVECVLTSAPEWNRRERRGPCRTAGEIAELLSDSPSLTDEARCRLRLRSALLYELAELPAIASALVRRNDTTNLVFDFFRREGAFASVALDAPIDDRLQTEVPSPALAAVSQDALDLASYETAEMEQLPELATDVLSGLSQEIALGLSATELRAFASVILHRASLSTRATVDSAALFELLQQMGFPAELWATQQDAIRAGLLDPSIDSWGLAAPTGTGKTFLTRLLILDSVRREPKSQVLYIVPSKALVYEVSQKLATAFAPFGLQVVAVTPQLVALDQPQRNEFADASVLVLTPEKADLLVRLGPDLFSRLALVVIDEAHHIESGTRGALLELYLWRLRRLAPAPTRFVFLSAVTPNIGQLVQWAGRNSRAHFSDQRATRMRVGVYNVQGKGKGRQGLIKYDDGTEVIIVPKQAERGIRDGIVQLARAIVSAGPVLTVAKGKRECERLAEQMIASLAEVAERDSPPLQGQLPDVLQRLDSRLEREMYPEVLLRGMLRWRVAYHHAGLPPRVRSAVEDAIRAGYIDFVFATTTLAEGVNFPFSSVIVQSLSLRPAPVQGRPVRYQPVTPRTFWNIAGRAGRPGFDKEGQVILFEPSLGLQRIGALVSDYMKSGLSDANPVTSALAAALKELVGEIRARRVTLDQISQVRISNSLPKEIVGTLNLLRVGIVHGRASGILDSPEDILQGSFAETALPDEQRPIVTRILRQQGLVVDTYFRDPESPPSDLVAELGLSLETLSELQNYVRSLEDRQILRMAEAVRFGAINPHSAEYVVRAVASRMAELEGSVLGDLFSDIILHWLAGAPFTIIKNRAGRASRQLGRLEDLISVVYSRIQFLLPWGLYAMHRLVAEEARGRGLPYDNQLQSLAYLADAGVPSFDALRLVYLNFERVDATRLADHYRKHMRSQGLDIVAWLSGERRAVIIHCLQGRDRRRIDFDLDHLLEDLKEGVAREAGRRT